MYDPFPDVVRIEPAGYCTHRCTFCPVGVEGGRRGLLPYAAYVRIFDRLPFVPRVLVLYHGGEPLLNPDIEQMINYASAAGVHRIILNTNGVLLNNQDFSNLDEMRVSFAGETWEEHNAIRLGSDFFFREGPKVLDLANSHNRPRQIVILSVTDTGRVANYLLDYFASNGCETGVVFEGIKRKTWARADNEPKPTNGAHYCRNLFTTFTIMANGDVPLCNDDLMGDVIIGNAIQSDPLDIWRKAQPLRFAFSNGYYPNMCQSCWVLDASTD